MVLLYSGDKNSSLIECSPCLSINPSPDLFASSNPDHLNTPRLIADSTGTTVWRWDQGEPFGNDVPNNNPSGLGAFDLPLRFPGQYFQPGNRTCYNAFHDYDPGIGRYLEPDPLGIF